MPLKLLAGQLPPNGWSGGQYSLFRFIFGGYLCAHFVQLVPWASEVYSSGGVVPRAADSPYFASLNLLAWLDSPSQVTALVVVAAVLSLTFAAGLFDRVAAVLLWYILACLFGRNPLTLNPSLPFVGWLLLAHAALPGRPYGSLGARGRVDPGGDWRMPAPIFTGAWILMALAYTYSGYTKLLSPSWMDGTALARILESPPARPTAVGAWLLELPELALQLATWGFLALELLFAPLALFRAVRPWLWLAMLSLQPALILLGGSADSSVGMMMVHFFTFNPAWIRARPAAAAEEFFYDGHCGLCQRSVRFFLAEDRSEKAFIFAPLQSEAFAAAIPPSERAGLPDSVVVRTAGGRLLVRSAAILHAMARLGGAWRLAAALARLVPRPLRDAAYDLVARLRHRLFARPPSMCPRMPERLRGRFRV